MKTRHISKVIDVFSKNLFMSIRHMKKSNTRFPLHCNTLSNLLTQNQIRFVVYSVTLRMRPSREKKAENCLFESGVLSFHLMGEELLILSLCVCVYIYIYIYIYIYR